jgi:hypothetical protein
VLLFAFLSAASDCTSSVVYWPFAGSFLPRYISWMAVGEGLSGVVAALLVQLQYLTCTDASSDPCSDFAFGPTQYFLALAVAVGCSALAFWCLENLRACELQRAFRSPEMSGGNSQPGYSLELLASESDGAGQATSSYSARDPHASSDGEKQLLSPGGTELYDDGDDGLRMETSAPVAVMSRSERRAMLCVVGWASCWQNGIVPAILAFATSPYGPRCEHKPFQCRLRTQNLHTQSCTLVFELSDRLLIH